MRRRPWSSQGAPTSGSTYFVSGYAGSLTPVEAHSGRCTAAPASRSFAKRLPSKISLNLAYAARAFAIAAVPWRSVLPVSCPVTRIRLTG